MITLAPPFSIGPSIVQVTSTTIKPLMDSEFHKIRPRNMKLAVLERLIMRLIIEEMLLALRCLHILDGSSSFLQIKKKTHNSLNEFEFLPDPITNYWVSCP